MPTWMRWILKKSLLMLLLAGALAALYTWATLNYVYSTGDRAGYLQKFSQRGWIFKTWEGELAMVNLPGAMPEIFHFSVRKPEAIDQIRPLLGQRITIEYNQHVGIPVNWWGETSYFATKASLIEPAAVPPASPSESRESPSSI